MIFCARATRGRGLPSLGLRARQGKSIAKQSEGRAGEKYLPVGGRVRTLRAVGDSRAGCGYTSERRENAAGGLFQHPASPPSREKTEERRSLDGRSEDCDHQNTKEGRRWGFIIRDASDGA